MTNLIIMVEDDRIIDDLARNIQAGLDDEWYAVRTWQELMPDMVGLMMMQDTVYTGIAWVFYIIVGFGIFGTILMMLYERMREFGMEPVFPFVIDPSIFLNQAIEETIEKQLSHIQLHHPDFIVDREVRYRINNAHDVLDELQRHPEVRFVAARTKTDGMVASAHMTAGVQIIGVFPEWEVETTAFDQQVEKGNYFSDATAYELGTVFVESAAFNELLGDADIVTEIALRLYDQGQSQVVANALKEAYPELLVRTWMDIAPDLQFVVEVTEVSMLWIMAIILLGVGFGILNTILMSVLERTRE